MLDIFLTVISGMFQLALVVWGIYVSLKPIKRHGIVIFGFIAIGMVSVGLTALLQVRSSATQTDLLQRINDIRETAKKIRDEQPIVLSGQARLDFGSMGDGVCSADQDIPVQGATEGDSPAIGWDRTLPKGMFGNTSIRKAGVVSVRLCNLSGETVTYNRVRVTATITRRR